MVYATSNANVGLYVEDPSKILSQAWRSPNPGEAVVEMLGNIKQQYPLDIGRVTLSVWSEARNRENDTRWQMARGMYGRELKWSIFNGFHGLSQEESIRLNRLVNQKTVLEQEILDAIRGFNTEQPYQSP